MREPVREQDVKRLHSRKKGKQGILGGSGLTQQAIRPVESHQASQNTHMPMQIIFKQNMFNAGEQWPTHQQHSLHPQKTATPLIQNKSKTRITIYQSKYPVCIYCVSHHTPERTTQLAPPRQLAQEQMKINTATQPDRNQYCNNQPPANTHNTTEPNSQIPIRQLHPNSHTQRYHNSNRKVTHTESYYNNNHTPCCGCFALVMMR